MRRTILFFLLLATIATLPFAGVHFFVLGMPIYMPELFVILAGMLFLHQRWRQYIKSEKTLPQWLVFPVSAMLIGLFFSSISNHIATSELGIIKAWFLFPILFGWLLFQAIQTSQQLHQVLLVWYATIVAVSLVALAYFFQGHLTYDGRLRGFYSSPNYLAFFLSPGIFLGWYFLKLTWDKKGGRSFFVWFSLLIVICLALSLTHSYIVIIATIVSFFTILFLGIKKSLASFATATVMLLFFIAIFLTSQMHTQKFYDLIHFSERSSLASRIIIWQSSWKMITDHPIIGIGPGNFQTTYLEYQKYFPPYLEWAVPHPHNLYLAFWLQSGILGLVGFLTLIAMWIRIIFPIIFSKDTQKASVARALFGIMLSILLIGFFDTPYWKNDLSYIFWFLIALGISLSQSTESEDYNLMR